MEKMDYNHFVSTNLGTGSLKVRMTDIRGKVVKDTIPKLPESGTSNAYTVPGARYCIGIGRSAFRQLWNGVFHNFSADVSHSDFERACP